MRAFLVSLAAVAACSSSDERLGRLTRDGTLEVVFAFHGATLDAREVGIAIRSAEPAAEVTDLRDGQVLVRVPRRWPDASAQRAAVTALRRRFPGIDRASWAGDRLSVRADGRVPGEDVAAVIADHGLPGTVVRAYVDDLGQTQVVFRLSGQDLLLARAIEDAYEVDARVVRSEVVPPAAPDGGR